MTLSQWITANWVTPYIQKAEARGEARSNAEWRAWLERKDAAEAQGLAFDEPPLDGRE